LRFTYDAKAGTFNKKKLSDNTEAFETLRRRQSTKIPHNY